MDAVPHFHFISGLPRSGSTLLSAILRQNPRFHAGMTSPVGAMLNAVLAQVSGGSEFALVVSTEQRRRVLRGLFTSFYANVAAPVVFDTNRGWTARLPALLDLFPEARVIACVRNVAWVMDSIEVLYRANPFENTRLFPGNPNRSTVYSRLEGLAQHDQLVGNAWSALREAFYGAQARALLVVDYEFLARAPEKVMPLVYRFLDEAPFAHDFENVEYDAEAFDIELGVPGLHTVRRKVGVTPRRAVIPPDLFDKFARMSFWTETAGSAAHVIAAQAKDSRAARCGDLVRAINLLETRSPQCRPMAFRSPGGSAAGSGIDGTTGFGGRWPARGAVGRGAAGGVRPGDAGAGCRRGRGACARGGVPGRRLA